MTTTTMTTTVAMPPRARSDGGATGLDMAGEPYTSPSERRGARRTFDPAVGRPGGGTPPQVVGISHRFLALAAPNKHFAEAPGLAGPAPRHLRGGFFVGVDRLL